MNCDNKLKYLTAITCLLILLIQQSSCNYLTHRTLSKGAGLDSLNNDPEPNYDISLNSEYQEFTTYLYPGNRIENFTAYFNTFFEANQDFDNAFDEYKATLISEYNKRLDSLGISPPISGSVKEKLDKSIERASKIIQFHKNSMYIDRAVLIIGKSYYLMADYINAERKFNEFISKLSSSDYADEAILYLGRTKVKLGKKEEGEKILRELLKTATDNEIKSITVRDIGILEFNKGNINEALSDFKASIDFSKDTDRKAEGQFIYAKILSKYKPQLAAAEYKKALDYSSDFDLTYFSKLNYAKGLVYNKQFNLADEILADMRKKYRDFPAYTQLIDLEIANSYYGQNRINEAKEKYFEVIIKYPSTPSCADAYYYLAKYEETVQGNYLKALVNYKKAVESNNTSDFYTESAERSATLDKYFNLLGEVKDNKALVIPNVNDELEAFRIQFNAERGIDQPPIETNSNGSFDNQGPPPQDDGSQKGFGKGKPGGFGNNYFKELSDSNKINKGPGPQQTGPSSDPTGMNPSRGKVDNNTLDKNLLETESKDSTGALNNDSLKTVQELFKKKTDEEKQFNAYFEIAEIFMYNIVKNDSAEYYLKYILNKFNEPQYEAKTLYTLANFYKNIKKDLESDETFRKVIKDYPNSVYAFEARKILGLTTDESFITQKPIDEIFSKAFGQFNDKEYAEAIETLHQIQNKFPDDTAVAKALYGIGYIYENGLYSKDSTISYYKTLKEKFPESEYTLKILPKLEYFASLEVKDSSIVDSTKLNISDSTNTDTSVVKTDLSGEVKDGNQGELKENSPEEVTPDSNVNQNGENVLSQEEIDKLLKEPDENTGEK